jgi:ribosomal protein S14
MLKWSAKNRLFFRRKQTTNLEMRVKLSNVFILWFLTKNSKIVLYNKISKYIVSNLMYFFFKLIKLVKLILICRLKYKKKILFKNIKITKILTCIARLHKITWQYPTSKILWIYRYFLIFSWGVNKDVIRYNLQKDFLYFKILNRKVLSYIFNVIITTKRFDDSFSRITAACFVTGRSRSVVRAFKLSRFKLREFANLGLFIGLSKSSW